MKLMASLAPAQAEVESGVAAKADHYVNTEQFIYLDTDRYDMSFMLTETTSMTYCSV